VVFASFLAAGIVPIIPFIFGTGLAALVTSFVVTGVALLVAGAIRSRYTRERPLLAGGELVGMAALGVGAAYLIGRLVGVAVPG
jgi:VIT1/CCC1 family predicted Fe2+/Mn2+ transporter